MEENKIPTAEDVAEEIVEDTEETVTEETVAEESEPEVTAEETAEEISEEAETPATQEEAPVEEEKKSKGDKKKLKKAEAEIAELRRALKEKDAALAEANDKYVRLFAEYDNFRRRSAKELEGRYADAVCDTLTEILPVLDNLDRAALYNVEGVEESPMGKGLELTRKSFLEILTKLGVSEIEAEGAPFDPDRHNAVMHVDDESLGENVVAEVFMKGYAKGDKVLRYSMVKVAN